MFEFLGFQDSRRSRLESEIAHLRKEVSRLGKRASRRGHDAYDDTRRGGEWLFEELSDMASDIIPLARSRAHSVERVARENPAATAAVVGLVVVGLVASIIYSSRR